MIYYTLTFIGGIFFTLFVLFIISLFDKPKTEMKYLRKGLLRKDYITGGGEDFYVNYEVGEIEKSTTKSKLIVLKSISSILLHNTNDSKIKELHANVNDSWVFSENIDWIEHTLEDKRDEKLTKLLG